MGPHPRAGPVTAAAGETSTGETIPAGAAGGTTGGTTGGTATGEGTTHWGRDCTRNLGPVCDGAPMPVWGLSVCLAGRLARLASLGASLGSGSAWGPTLWSVWGQHRGSLRPAWGQSGVGPNSGHCGRTTTGETTTGETIPGGAAGGTRGGSTVMQRQPFQLGLHKFRVQVQRQALYGQRLSLKSFVRRWSV